MFETFDSFAPPQLQKKVSGHGWDHVNLDEVREKLASVIEEQKANDPAELKRTIADLKRKLTEAERKAPEVKQSPPVEVPILDAAGRQTLESAITVCTEVLEECQKRDHILSSIRDHVVKLVERANVRLAMPCPVSGPQVRREKWTSHSPAPIANGHSEEPSGGLRRMMVALAQRSPLTKRQLGVRAGFSSTSGTFGTYLGKLRSNHWIEGRDELKITSEGLSALGPYDPLPEGKELLNYWLGQLGRGGEWRMLIELANAWPKSMTKEELGKASNISPTSGTFGTYLGHLRSLELIEGPAYELRASNEFFK